MVFLCYFLTINHVELSSSDIPTGVSYELPKPKHLFWHHCWGVARCYKDHRSSRLVLDYSVRLFQPFLSLKLQSAVKSVFTYASLRFYQTDGMKMQIIPRLYSPALWCFSRSVWLRVSVAHRFGCPSLSAHSLLPDFAACQVWSISLTNTPPQWLPSSPPPLSPASGTSSLVSW